VGIIDSPFNLTHIMSVKPLNAHRTNVLAGSTLAFLATASISMPPALAGSLSVNQLFIFGSSLADAGNFYALTSGLIPLSPPYFDGRSSNGPVWSEYFADNFGLSPALWTGLPPGSSIPSDGINFAIAGGKTDDTHISGIPELPGLQQQVDAFTLGFLGGGTLNNPNALAIVQEGANDYFGGQTNPAIPVSNLSNQIQRLATAGVKNILVSNLPDLGRTPLGLSLGQAGSEGLSTLTNFHNALLTQSINQLSQVNPNTNFIRFDFYGLVNTVLDAPDQFGFANATEGCTNINPSAFPNLPDPLYNPNCSGDLAIQNTFVFFDNQHPTTKAHQLIANAALQSVHVPEPSTVLAFGLLSLGLLGKASLKRRS
jgi:phospholipase/lecithinase/hemolysin